MSTGSDTPATLSEGTREDLDVQDDQVPQSTILYLLQEATKLAPPAKQDTLEWRLTNGTCSKEQSQQYPSSPVSSACCPPVPSAQPCKYVETAPKSQQKYYGSFSFIQSQQGSSPWEVMSLINLQCERLLHPVREDGEEGRDTPLLPTSAHKGSVDYLRGNTIPDRTRDQSEFQEVGKRMHLQNVRNKTVKSEPWCFEATEEEVRPTGESSPDLSFYSERSSRVSHSSTLVRSLVLEGENEQCPIIYPEDTQEDGETRLSTSDTGATYNLKRTYHLCNESQEECSFIGSLSKAPDLEGTETRFLDKCSPPVESLSLLASIVHRNCQKQGKNFFTKPEGFLLPDAAACSSVPAADLDGPSMEVDGNPNLILPLESHINGQRPGSSSEELSGDFHAVIWKSAPVKDTSSSPGKAHRSSRDDAVLKPVDPQVAKMALGPCWRGRTPRKQRHPTRSADLCDPDFQGVSFRMRTEFNDNRDQCRLLITSKYSAEFWKSGRRGRGSRMRSLINSLKTSSSEEEIDPVSLSKNKTCASCNTKTTPLWRDAEDGTPLCNACGIRYKKYRIRCHRCWYIPRKEGNSNCRCSRCGDMLRLACSHRKNSKDLAVFTAT
ncbi:GATA-type zinc finger protein 1 [Brienomyrus brachyistius]|uniref:GATA-type zinc finger protein 1 n=1 Tax=Brienomyrus brachyistius TaxID=42636 RepID=UPI0020B1E68C|nr:GATA-type zinc finger protein 1 [Brienomyrus brachyistius]